MRLKESLIPVAMTMALVAGCNPNRAAEIPPTPIAAAQEPTQEAVDAYFQELPHLSVEGGAHASVDIIATVHPEKLQDLPPEATRKVGSAIVHLSAKYQNYPLYGSGFLMRGSSGTVQLITAGHNVQGIEKGSMSWKTNEGADVPVSRAKWYYARSPEREDISIVQPKSLFPEERALPIRDLHKRPLKLGEQLFFMNFQQLNPQQPRTAPGNPASYSMLFMGRQTGDAKLGTVIGDLMPNKEEDTLDSGASGGVVVDKDAQVVGASISTNKGGSDAEICGRSLPFRQGVSVNNKELTASLTVPETNDECATGLWGGSIRLVDSQKGFEPVPGASYGVTE